MSAMQPLRRRARRTRAEMNVVPYIDVMLVLLIIFMAVSPMIQTKVLNLPSVSASAAAQEPPLVVQMDAQGKLSSAGSEYVNTADMIAAVQNSIANKPQAVVLAADKAMSYGDVMAVMDALKKARVERVGLLLSSTDADKP
jgi:biopolymer transport protein TolR